MDSKNRSNRFGFSILWLVLLCLFFVGQAGCKPPVVKSSPVELNGSTDVDQKRPVQRDWLHYRGDAQASGVAAGNLPQTITRLWKYRVTEGSFGATAVISQGVVYLGDLDGTFYAILLSDGSEKWKVKIDSGFLAAAAIRNDLIYVGDLDGVFHCYEVETGHEKWKFKTDLGAEIDSAANFYQSDSLSVIFSSQDSTLYCLDAATGKKKWIYQAEDQLRCSPTIIGDKTFLAGCDSKLHIVDLNKEGTKSKQVMLSGPTGCTPAATADYVYFGTQGGNFYCINWRTARVEWEYSNKINSLPYNSAPAVDDDLVVFGGDDRKMHALDPKNGDVKWTFRAKRSIEGSAVLIGNRVVFGAGDGNLYVLDRKTGKKVFQYQAGGSFSTSPAVSQNRLVIASDDGIVYCFGEKK